jgi:hypothetical protein
MTALASVEEGCFDLCLRDFGFEEGGLRPRPGMTRGAAGCADESLMACHNAESGRRWTRGWAMAVLAANRRNRKRRGRSAAVAQSQSEGDSDRGDGLDWELRRRAGGRAAKRARTDDVLLSLKSISLHLELFLLSLPSQWCAICSFSASIYSHLCTQGKHAKTRKFAVAKKIVNPNDSRLSVASLFSIN